MAETVSEHYVFGGLQGVYRHSSRVLDCDMEFSVFRPGGKGPFPALWYLSGLTCTQENATTKAGFQRVAAEHGLMIICPDTSPRGNDVADDASYDFGQGAGFYVNATEQPWANQYHMYDYVTSELPAIIAASFQMDTNRQGITGHSMGGHGALTIAQRCPDQFKSVSAFAPIVSPTNCPWGRKALEGYLGPDQSVWAAHDACALVREKGAQFDDILIDQGAADSFLQDQLKPELFAKACHDVDQKLTLRYQEGYDHSYYFIASFIEDHLRFHSARLRA